MGLKRSQQTKESKNANRLVAIAVLSSRYQIVKLFDLLLESNKAKLKLVSGCRKQEMKFIFYKS
ncbi:hypothetical protein [Microseira sp. BLCC-F43]|uniref:hypothetical protein n=1 Tax=Microseira sp. BLCC-F43 TaxID=3153602 RepID=UPI0035BA5553